MQSKEINDYLIDIKRPRKSREQIFALQEIQEKGITDRDYLKNVANELGLTVTQIYKWLWDNKRIQSRQSLDEFGGYSKTNPSKDIDCELEGLANKLGLNITNTATNLAMEEGPKASQVIIVKQEPSPPLTLQMSIDKPQLSYHPALQLTNQMSSTIDRFLQKSSNQQHQLKLCKSSYSNSTSQERFLFNKLRPEFELLQFRGSQRQESILSKSSNFTLGHARAKPSRPVSIDESQQFQIKFNFKKQSMVFQAPLQSPYFGKI